MSTGAGASDLLHAEDPGLDAMVRGEQSVAARSPLQLFWRRFNLAYAFTANVLGGIVVVYAIGIPFTSVYADVSLSASFVGSFSFIPGDLVKALIAALVADGVRRAYPVIELPARQPAHS